MNKVATLSEQDRKDLFHEVSARKGFSEAIAEKDFWVCWVLMKLFAHPQISRKILFKGGTSLSKVFNLIERFSEDIDLVIDWRLLTGKDPLEDRSRKQQKIMNEDLVQKSDHYVKTTMKGWIKEAVGEFCDIELSSHEKGIVLIKYPCCFEDQYVRPEVRLEVGPRSEWIPHGEYFITPYAAEEFPKLFENPKCRVVAINAQRTFWEKAAILHKESFRSKGGPMPERYSRHYYDMTMMGQSWVKDKALENLELLDRVVDFNKRFFVSSWANYDLAKSGTMKLVPPVFMQEILKKDYVLMRGMIVGEPPDFDVILSQLEALEREINALGEPLMRALF
jgi:hypothetical protein